MICILTPEVGDILKILWERGEIAPSFPQFFVTRLDFHIKTGTRLSLRNKQLFENKQG